MTCVVDTHALIWAYIGNPSLSTRAAEILTRAGRPEILVSDVTLTEAARLVFHRRFVATGNPRAWLEALAAQATIVPVSTATAWLAASLAWAHGDPCDRQIVATALWHGAPLLTADRIIARDAKALGLTVIW